VEDKDCEWSAAAFGMTGLETALSVVQHAMVDTKLMTWSEVADRMSYRPAAIGQITEHGRPLEAGAPANLVLLDPTVERTVVPGDSVSLSRNTPFDGMTLPGKVVATFLRGTPTVLEGELTR
jgi:dihydroorotase